MIQIMVIVIIIFVGARVKTEKDEYIIIFLTYAR